MSQYHLGNYIAKQRTHKNLSIRKLSQLANVSHTEIARIESGERKHPSPLVLKNIAHVLGCNFLEMMRIAGYLEDDHHTESISSIFADLSTLTKEEIEEVKKFIKRLRHKHDQN